MVFHGLLGTCSSFKIARVCVLVLKKSLLRDNPCISPQGCDEVVLKSVSVKSFYFLKEQVLKNHLPTRKGNHSMISSFRKCYPTMNEWVAPSLAL